MVPPIAASSDLKLWTLRERRPAILGGSITTQLHDGFLPTFILRNVRVDVSVGKASNVSTLIEIPVSSVPVLFNRLQHDSVTSEKLVASDDSLNPGPVIEAHH